MKRTERISELTLGFVGKKCKRNCNKSPNLIFVHSGWQFQIKYENLYGTEMRQNEHSRKKREKKKCIETTFQKHGKFSSATCIWIVIYIRSSQFTRVAVVVIEWESVHENVDLDVRVSWFLQLVTLIYCSDDSRKFVTGLLLATDYGFIFV